MHELQTVLLRMARLNFEVQRVSKQMDFGNNRLQWILFRLQEARASSAETDALGELQFQI